LQNNFALWHLVIGSSTGHHSTTAHCLLKGTNPLTLVRKGSTSTISIQRNCGIRVEESRSAKKQPGQEHVDSRAQGIPNF
jgi:hypothetical protein